ncbi:hypothetical protein C498_19689 [Haloferax volcanii DS2]|uniref:Uncharacterized protein n=1 Tax=Haloferax volcanii (strain ATCC 29605 / DSM 3757 / JCM 8879 / NBRC 14742 / NCIMB 2012 / VKM B-1768 / DS2) TaxID=309800 RepID=L9UE18_HALVD|nr:hypothetical protein C498_19689 [Haloferax volcanii DS2]
MIPPEVLEILSDMVRDNTASRRFCIHTWMCTGEVTRFETSLEQFEFNHTLNRDERRLNHECVEALF